MATVKQIIQTIFSGTSSDNLLLTVAQISNISEPNRVCLKKRYIRSDRGGAHRIHTYVDTRLVKEVIKYSIFMLCKGFLYFKSTTYLYDPWTGAAVVVVVGLDVGKMEAHIIVLAAFMGLHLSEFGHKVVVRFGTING